MTPEGVLDNHAVLVERGTIVGVEPSAVCDHAIVAPGFVDLQVNGINDVNVATADADGWLRLDRALLSQGVTSWCPTLVTAPLDVLEQRIAAVSALLDRGVAHAVGLHLEGPFLGGAAGAHQGVDETPIDLDWLAALPSSVRIVTLAPERAGALQTIALLVGRGVTVSLGHTTATAEQTEAAVDAGASMFTHLFNASGVLHHRAPGALGVALTDDRLVAGLIADGIHVDRRVMKLAWRAKGAGGVALVTDAVGWRFGHLGTAAIQVRDGAPRLTDGTLAGTILTMNEAVKRTVEEVGIDLADACAAASTVPAMVLGLDDRGSITPGRRADLVALSVDYQVEQTWVGGSAQLPFNGS